MRLFPSMVFRKDPFAPFTKGLIRKAGYFLLSCLAGGTDMTNGWILAGDIGGTKTALGLFSPGDLQKSIHSGNLPMARVSERYPSQEFSGLVPIVDAFLKKILPFWTDIRSGQPLVLRARFSKTVVKRPIFPGSLKGMVLKKASDGSRGRSDWSTTWSPWDGESMWSGTPEEFTGSARTGPAREAMRSWSRRGPVWERLCWKRITEAFAPGPPRGA